MLWPVPVPHPSHAVGPGTRQSSEDCCIRYLSRTNPLDLRRDNFCCFFTVGWGEVLLMEETLHQLRLVVYPIIYRGFTTKRRSSPSFWTINSMSMVHLLNVTLTAIETIGTIWYLVMFSMKTLWGFKGHVQWVYVWCHCDCTATISAGFDAMLMQPNLSFLSHLSCNMENKITTLPLFPSSNSVFFASCVSPHLVTLPARHGWLFLRLCRTSTHRVEEIGISPAPSARSPVFKDWKRWSWDILRIQVAW